MTKCIKIHKKYGEKVRKLLIKHDLMDRDYKVLLLNEYLLLPIIDQVKCEDLLRKHSIEFEIVECNPPQKKITRMTKYRIPSHDIVGKIVIVREKVVREYGESRITKVLRSVYPWIEAIYVKHGTEHDYRLSRLRLIWGREVKYIVYKEYGLEFFIDLYRVYFNPRLSTEHRLLAENVKNGEIIFDLFSGFGGFSIHIAHLKKALIYANDINPHAIYCLLKSIVLNKRKLRGKIIASVFDARDIPKYFKSSVADRIIANLPHKSIEFFETYNYLSHKDTILYLYIVGNDIESVLNKIRDLIENKWLFIGYRRVLDYSPYTYIFRIDLKRL